jgi:hypothetical protein
VKCPKCGQTKRFSIEITVPLIILCAPNETYKEICMEDANWSYYDYASCLECNWEGLVFDLEEE